MRRARRRPAVRRAAAAAAALLAVTALLAACSGSGSGDGPKSSAPPPTGSNAECGAFRIAYDPTNGYEASAFIVGTLAQRQLGCDVQFVKTTSRNAWRLVSRGDADVYLDAYGNEDLRARYTGEGDVTSDDPSDETSSTSSAPPGPTVNVVGPNGIKGGVDLLAPAFMGERGLNNSQDLNDTDRIGWGVTTPAITTSPALLPLARSVVDFLRLDYIVRNSAEIYGRPGQRTMFPLVRSDDTHAEPNLYLVEAPRSLIGDGAGRQVVDLPESSADDCRHGRLGSLCSLTNFRYQKIVNADFATSGSPAYALVYNYELSDADAATIEELVELSGYNVGAVDVASWLNTHKKEWKAWLP